MSLADDGRWFCFGFAVAFKTLAGVTFFVVGALRVLVLRAGFAAVDLETVEAVGIREKRVYLTIINAHGSSNSILLTQWNKIVPVYELSRLLL